MAVSFVYILMHGREEWVLIQFGSQHKRVERAVRPVFPDHLKIEEYINIYNNKLFMRNYFSKY